MRVLRLTALGVVVCGLLALPSAAFGRATDNPTVNVNFFINGTISVSLPGGTPVGATSGSPTVIPAGWYTFEMIGPGGCASIPQFILKGPGLYLSDNLDGGESAATEHIVQLQPNTTYTWTNDNSPSVVHTFQTNSTIVGSAPSDSSKNGLSSSKHTTVSSSSLIGSQKIPFRGTLTAVVNAKGDFKITIGGKPVGKLMAGRYTVKVTDQSATSAFTLRRTKYVKVNVTGGAFVGKRTADIQLGAGKWYFAPHGVMTSGYVTVVTPTSA